MQKPSGNKYSLYIHTENVWLVSGSDGAAAELSLFPKRIPWTSTVMGAGTHH